MLRAVWLVYGGGATIAVASPRERLAVLIFPAALIGVVVITSVPDALKATDVRNSCPGLQH